MNTLDTNNPDNPDKTGATVEIASGEPSRSPSTDPAEQLRDFEEIHEWDPNLPEEKRDAVKSALNAGDVEAEIALEGELEEDSPYPEVRAAVRNYDEDVPVNTIRAWTLGLIFSTIGSALNMLFSMRAPSIIISSVVALLVSWPCGMAWEKFMPKRKFRTFGKEWSLNPGPFNMKEHTIITIMANVTFGTGPAYSTDTLLAMSAFYKKNLGWGFQLLFTFTTQILGFGLAGIFRRFLVWPAAMIWPVQLPSAALFYALHKSEKVNPAETGGWIMSRYRWFLIIFGAGFVWYWFPGYIWQGLSVFAFVTWIRPQNPVINQVFGGWTGISVLPITFDWTQIAGYNQSPLVAPWHAIANTLIGLFVFFVVVTCGIHFSGSWYSAYLPISDSGSYDNTFTPYNVSRILTPEMTLNLAEYKKYSPLFLSTTFALCYGLSFATITAVIFHTALFNGKEIWKKAREARNQEDDIHMRMMKKYPDVPDWWYMVLFVITLGVSFGVVCGYDTHLSAWAFVISIIISIVWMVPIGMIQAVTNIQIGLNVLTEFLVGYIQPGRPLAMMMFKTYGYITMLQGLIFSEDLKLGHYMKLPPRTLFATQIVSTLWSSIVQIAVMNWALGSIKGVCEHDQPDNYTCPGGRVFFNASVIWGLIGPQRIFSPGSIYSQTQWFWLIGAILPCLFYILARLFPKSNLRYLNAPVIFGGTGTLPPATPLNFWAWGLVGWFFNSFLRRTRRGWWMSYNYVTSAALDSGLAISTIVIFLTLFMTNTNPPNWWGNNVVLGAMDYQGTAVQKTVPPGGKFGPETW
ncbi:small oligopeptide transporter [Xylona heveae TC161]|uniref:Small oligopeptide transporter n=1 Tax=Xylona heveae (strain CBS 132557 / TC161) TaxID=1328760 RepID=A0A165H7E2_XYLHT|nr:small oligopeptide transporter [Xylona heveae TC161]KZF23085.1 small oligopeptide transporter [Xylona heveae TC161]